MQNFCQFEVVYHILDKAIHLNHLNQRFQVRRLATLTMVSFHVQWEGSGSMQKVRELRIQKARATKPIEGRLCKMQVSWLCFRSLSRRINL